MSRDDKHIIVSAGGNTQLEWPVEQNAELSEKYPGWHDHGANRVMDFHGSPFNADVVLFSDGNHHMALMDAVQAFETQYSCTVFYLTLPPALLLRFAQSGGVSIGNLCLPIQPNVFIGPDFYLDKISSQQKILPKIKFSSSAGCSFVTRKTEQLFDEASATIKHLMASGKRLFISHPKKETASYDVYRQTLINMALHEGVEENDVLAWLDPAADHIVLGQDVHHREVPLALAQNLADYSLVYHHLALRYSRIFADQLGLHTIYASGTSEMSSLHVCTDYFVSVVDDKTEWSLKFYEYMQTDAADIYKSHGLLA